MQGKKQNELNRSDIDEVKILIRTKKGTFLVDINTAIKPNNREIVKRTLINYVLGLLATTHVVFTPSLEELQKLEKHGNKTK